VKLAPPERKELAPLLSLAAAELPPGAFRARLAGLSERLEGELAPEDEEALALFVETLAQSRRLASEGARVERLLGSAYRRTARGRAAGEQLEDASGLLEALIGQRLTGAGLSLLAPGTYLLRLETEEVELRVELGPRGVDASAALGAA
jgi:hypothetical protein